MNWNSRYIAYFILRLTIGLVFFLVGVEKLMKGVFEFAGGLEKQFAKTFLPSDMVSLFGITLPFIETLIGALLIVGLFTRFTTALTGLLMAVLTAGLAIVGNPEGVAHNLIYSFILFGLLYYSGDNRLALDRLFEPKESRIPVEFKYRKSA